MTKRYSDSNCIRLSTRKSSLYWKRRIQDNKKESARAGEEETLVELLYKVVEGQLELFYDQYNETYARVALPWYDETTNSDDSDASDAKTSSPNPFQKEIFNFIVSEGQKSSVGKKDNGANSAVTPVTPQAFHDLLMRHSERFANEIAEESRVWQTFSINY